MTELERHILENQTLDPEMHRHTVVITVELSAVSTEAAEYWARGIIPFLARVIHVKAKKKELLLVSKDGQVSGHSDSAPSEQTAASSTL